MLNLRSIGGKPRPNIRSRLPEPPTRSRWLRLFQRKRCPCGMQWPRNQGSVNPTPTAGPVHPAAPWSAFAGARAWFAEVSGFVAPIARRRLLVEAADMMPLITAGDVVWVPEHAHHGSKATPPGELRLRVTKVPPDVRPANEWIELRGFQILANGTESPEETWHLVRLARVRVSLHPPEPGR
jgi:hypothetical protein